MYFSTLITQHSSLFVFFFFFLHFSEIKGGAVPKEYIPGVQKGIESVLGNGVIAGFPVLGIKAVLVDGSYHDVDSSVLAFEIAGRAATREGLKKCKSRLKVRNILIKIYCCCN